MNRVGTAGWQPPQNAAATGGGIDGNDRIGAGCDHEPGLVGGHDAVGVDNVGYIDHIDYFKVIRQDHYLSGLALKHKNKTATPTSDAGRTDVGADRGMRGTDGAAAPMGEIYECEATETSGRH